MHPSGGTAAAGVSLWALADGAGPKVQVLAGAGQGEACWREPADLRFNKVCSRWAYTILAISSVMILG